MSTQPLNHIVGKVYDPTQKNMTKLIHEVERLIKEVELMDQLAGDRLLEIEKRDEKITELERYHQESLLKFGKQIVELEAQLPNREVTHKLANLNADYSSQIANCKFAIQSLQVQVAELEQYKGHVESGFIHTCHSKCTNRTCNRMKEIKARRIVQIIAEQAFDQIIGEGCISDSVKDYIYDARECIAEALAGFKKT